MHTLINIWVIAAVMAVVASVLLTVIDWGRASAKRAKEAKKAQSLGEWLDSLPEVGGGK